MTKPTKAKRGLRLATGPGPTDGPRRPEPAQGCYDCATCTSRAEFALTLGRSTDEVQRLAKRCESCGHRLHRHLHGFLRAARILPDPDVFAVEAPSPDSALGRLRTQLALD